MKTLKQSFHSLSLIVLGIVFAIGVNIAFAVWTGPSQNPPEGNVAEPLNVSSNTQILQGSKTIQGNQITDILYLGLGTAINGILGVNGITQFFSVPISAIFDGNVGIGTANPQAKLDVAGGVKIGNTTSCVDGSIRYSSDSRTDGCKDFEGCRSGSWVSLTGDICSPPTVPTCSLFTYSDWSACQPNNTKTRTITASSPQGCTGGNAILSESCNYVIGGGTQDRIILWGWYGEWACSGVWGDAYASGPSYSCRIYCSTGEKKAVSYSSPERTEITCTAR